jgi:glyoxylase-like metal-dependent hydrolase (beta-lactamase superfamily II)
MVAVLLPALPALAQRDYSKVEVKTEKLGEGIYMLAGAGGNLGLGIGEDAVFLIDDQYAPMTPKIEAAVAALTPKPVKFVLNTHWHGDHTGGNEALGKAGAIIIAHDNVRRRLTTDQMFAGMLWKALPKEGLPVITFASDATFHINGDEVRAIHVPRAHTDGDVIVQFVKGNVVHMGDIYWNGMYPIIDFDAGGTPEGMVAAADRALSFCDDKTRIIPGHGPLSNRLELKAYRDMLEAISGRVKQLVQQGKKLEEIVAMNVSSDYDSRFGVAFMKGPKFVENVAKFYLKN